MKTQSNKTQKIIFILLNVITFILVLNFFMLGFPLAILFNLSAGSHVLLAFFSLFIGSYTWSEIITFNELYIY